VKVKLGEQGVDVRASDNKGRTALHFAAKSGKPETVQVLAELGADVGV